MASFPIDWELWLRERRINMAITKGLCSVVDCLNEGQVHPPCGCQKNACSHSKSLVCLEHDKAIQEATPPGADPEVVTATLNRFIQSPTLRTERFNS